MVNINPEYIIIGINLLLVFFISFIFLSLSYFINYQDNHFVKLSSYECGFLPFDDARGAFNIEFYLVGILFVIFDLEIVFLFPLCVCMSVSSYTLGVTSMLFVLILLIDFFMNG